MKKIIIFILSLFIFIPNVDADSRNLVNIYLFHSNSCPHCKEEIKILDELEDRYDNIRVYKYEISDTKNSMLLSQVSEIYNTKITSVPFTIIGNKTFSGFSTETSKRKFIGAIEYFSNYGYVDKVADLQNLEKPTYQVNANDPDIDNYLENYGNYTISLPLIGNINTNDLSLPISALIMGSIDGFNPCTIWILIFLIATLISLEDKKRMLILGSAFILNSSIIYFISLIILPNLATIISGNDILRFIIGLIIIIGGVFSLKPLISKRKINNKRLIIIGITSLIISLNLLELTSSFGLVSMFNQTLFINNVTILEQILYTLVYILFFLIDELIILIIIITSLKVDKIKSKHKVVAKLTSGFILFILGLVFIMNPNLLVFKI